jgi:glycosyltransferase involved in cell wall biosynthesis
MNILILEPYFTGSHAAWAEEYARRSRHDVKILSLPGRHWKWRMHGGAITLARRFSASGYRPDLVLAGDMLDLTTFLALARPRMTGVRTAVYFHENQLSYPWSQTDADPGHGRDAHYGFINVASALAADAVIFNSEYHRSSFLDAIGPFLEAFPDHTEPGVPESIRAKTHVLHLGLDLESFDPHRTRPAPGDPPLILWNHRWEYDKNPDEFFRALFRLHDEGLDFRLALLGESFTEKPPIFEEAAIRLVSRIVTSGYVEDFATYAAWLWKADILPVTSIHDFFGASVVKAIYCNCYPILPRRLVYPEHIPPTCRDDHLYADFEDLVTRLRQRITDIAGTRQIKTRHFVSHYDWGIMCPFYDRFFEAGH